jgi:protein ImuB
LLKLIHLDLIANPPAAAVRSITVQAEVDKPSRAQLGLFSPQFPEPMRLEVTLARLAAVVGSVDRVGSPKLRDSHQRDAFQMGRFAASEKAPATEHTRFVAIRILRPPEPLFMQLHEDCPQSFVFRCQQYRVIEAYGPWATSGAWWTPERWLRKQWDVLAQASDGERLCCQIAHDLVRQRWQVEALYD